jgi:hypothetical protein
MLDELRQYYEMNGIAAMKFSCSHFDDCSAGWDKFTKAKEAFVSSGYENHELPRLLFLSLDSGKGDRKDKNRTLENVREQEEINFNIESLKSEQGKHWYRTHELAHWFLRKYRWSLHIDQVQRYFAHTNSAKCCMNLDNEEKADKRLFFYCKDFISGEVTILDPDILVTQGEEAEQAIIGKFDELDITNFIVLAQSLPEVRVISINDAPVLWVHTYHPRNYGKFNDQRRNKFHIYTGLALEFMNKTKRWNGKIT